MNRHDLVEVSAQGREEICQSFDNSKLEDIRNLIVNGVDGILIPGIVRRAEEGLEEGYVALGFSSPFLVNGSRLRIPTTVKFEHAIRITSPYEVLAMEWETKTNCLKALKDVKEYTLKEGLRIGVWGSAGLQVFTGLPYTHNNSDLDLLLEEDDYSLIKEASIRIKEICEKNDCSMDIELILANGYGVKVAELLMESKSVMGKGIKDVVLLSKAQILESLSL